MGTRYGRILQAGTRAELKDHLLKNWRVKRIFELDKKLTELGMVNNHLKKIVNEEKQKEKSLKNWHRQQTPSQLGHGHIGFSGGHGHFR
jgi:hypothetical protein